MLNYSPSGFVRVQCSPASAKRFIRLFLGINPTDYWFHQTLTFKDRVADMATTQADLKKLLDSLGRASPDMACFWIAEYQKSLGIHFHVIFLFFGTQPSQPEDLRKTFGHAVFTRWNKLHGGKLARMANKITLRKKDFGCINYLLKGIDPTAKHLPRERHWNGTHNRRLIKAHSSPVSKSVLQDYYERLFPTSKGQPPPAASGCTQSEVKRLKDYLKADGRCDWKDFKKSHGKSHLSDIEFCTYLNSAQARG